MHGWLVFNFWHPRWFPDPNSPPFQEWSLSEETAVSAKQHQVLSEKKQKIFISNTLLHIINYKNNTKYKKHKVALLAIIKRLKLFNVQT